MTTRSAIRTHSFGPRMTGIAIAAMITLAGLASAAVAGELIMFDSKTCTVCAKFNREVAPDYAKSDSAKLFPLRRLDVGKGKVDFAMTGPRPVVTPTFVFVHEGKELGRFSGYPSKEIFYQLAAAAAADVQEASAKTN